MKSVSSILIICPIAMLGCWQEVRYVPSAEPEAPLSVPVAFPTEQPMETEPSEPAETKLTEEKTVQAMPSADDLFAEASGENASDVAELTPETEPDLIVEKSELAPDPAKALAAWRLGSKWSLAVGIYGKGFGEDRYGPVWDEATREAGMLGVMLPALPEAATEERTAVTADFLLAEAGPELGAEVGKHLTAGHQALFDLATKTHGLLLIYTPENADVKPLTAAIRQAGGNSGLPRDMWMPLVGLLDVRADFTDIKQAVFQLHREAEAHLADQATR